MKIKTLRYYWWIIRAFTKKNLKLILLSSFITSLLIFTLILFTPYLAAILTPNREVIGVTGTYYTNNLPDEVLSKVSRGLVSLNEKGEIVPALAERWEVKNGGKEFTFYFKKNIFWASGKPFKASDLEYQFKDVETKVIDDSTIRFNLKKPLAIFPTYLTKPIVKNPVDGVIGLYKVDRVKARYGVVSEISLSPNKNDLPSIVYKFYDDDGKLINAYKKGEITQMTIANKSVADSFLKWKNTQIEKSIDYSRLLTLFLNLKNPMLADKEIRQALVASIDRDKFIQLGEIASGPVAPSSWAYNPNIKKLIFNPVIAKKTFKREEATASAKLEFKTYYDYLSVASDINTNLQEAGLNTNLSLMSFETDNKFDLLLAFWKVPSDPDQYFFWHSTQAQGNITSYKNVKVDKLLEDGRSTLSVVERKKHYEQFQRVLVDDTPALFIYHPYVYTISRK